MDYFSEHQGVACTLGSVLGLFTPRRITAPVGSPPVREEAPQPLLADLTISEISVYEGIF